MPDQVYPVARGLEFGRYDLARIHGSDAEGHEGGRHVYVLEGAGHGVLASDGRKAEGVLHLQGAEQSAERLAPSVGILGHALEVFLIREAHTAPVGT